MNIRLATTQDLTSIREVFLVAKERMVKDGNTKQWERIDYPFCYTEEDIKLHQCYVVTDDNDEVVATFVFILGKDPTYSYIEGKWLNDAPYGTIHRIASNGKIKGIFDIVINYVKSFNVDIRIDTHKDNRRMIKHINENNFQYCGIIYVRDGTARNAYQLIKV